MNWVLARLNDCRKFNWVSANYFFLGDWSANVVVFSSVCQKFEKDVTK